MSELYKVSEVKLTYETQSEDKKKVKVNTSAKAYKLLLENWEQIEYRESFKILLLNRSNQVLGINTISMGGISETTVDIRMILQASLLANATSIIAVHNHPSGTTIPSSNDDFLTKKIKKATEAIGVTLADHLIITKDGYYSYSDEGRL